MATILNHRLSRRARHLARPFCENANAATSIEYALIAALVSIGILTSGLAIREQLVSIMSRVAAGFS
jgi:pilus assembly protein Flp/PilA